MHYHHDVRLHLRGAYRRQLSVACVIVVCPRPPTTATTTTTTTTTPLLVITPLLTVHGFSSSLPISSSSPPRHKVSCSLTLFHYIACHHYHCTIPRTALYSSSPLPSPLPLSPLSFLLSPLSFLLSLPAVSLLFSPASSALLSEWRQSVLTPQPPLPLPPSVVL